MARGERRRASILPSLTAFATRALLTPNFFAASLIVAQARPFSVFNIVITSLLLCHFCRQFGVISRLISVLGQLMEVIGHFSGKGQGHAKLWGAGDRQCARFWSLSSKGCGLPFGFWSPFGSSLGRVASAKEVGASSPWHAGARAQAGFEGIPRALGGSGCPLAAAVTALNFFRGTQPAFKVAKMMHLTLLPIPHTARVTHPARTYAQVFRVGTKNPLLSLRFRAISDAKWAQKGVFGAKCGRNVGEMWTKC